MGIWKWARRRAGGLLARARRGAERGQGTVEYVALILLVAGLMAGVIVAGKGLKGDGIANAVVTKLKQTIENVGSGKR
jgi:hypothetical protein